jgi:hypothetical protein
MISEQSDYMHVYKINDSTNYLSTAAHSDQNSSSYNITIIKCHSNLGSIDFTELLVNSN